MVQLSHCHNYLGVNIQAGNTGILVSPIGVGSFFIP